MTAKAQPLRPDPFELFESFPSATLSPWYGVRWLAPSAAEAERRLNLGVANYAPHLFLTPIERADLYGALQRTETIDLGELVAAGRQDEAVLIRTLLWLAKFGVIAIEGSETTPT
ncbi:MAG: hypothetical protein FJX66_07840 [Alphaproteobacteria bacterium]|nr:hypothetical protein [Alphaproteobacteria bacterium]